MQELLNIIKKYQITADQLILLYCIQEGIRSSNLVTTIEKPLLELKSSGLIDNTNSITSQGRIILQEADKIFKANKNTKQNIISDTDFIKNLEEYREIFPRKKLPSGKTARTNIEDLKEKMAKFFIKYPQYNWETVLSVTEEYVDKYASTEYLYMKTAGYYISKDGESELATDCELYMEGGEENIGSKFKNFTIS